MQETVTEMLENFGLEDYAGSREWLRSVFQELRYRDKTDPLRIWMEKLIKNHEDYCRKSGDDLLIRRHNTFVLMYFQGYSLSTIRRKQMLCIREISRDLNIVFDSMMIFAFGIDGLKQKPGLGLPEWKARPK